MEASVAGGGVAAVRATETLFPAGFLDADSFLFSAAPDLSLDAENAVFYDAVETAREDAEKHASSDLGVAEFGVLATLVDALGFNDLSAF